MWLRACTQERNICRIPCASWMLYLLFLLTFMCPLPICNQATNLTEELNLLRCSDCFAYAYALRDMLYDRSIARVFIVLTTLLYVYYVVWIGVTPFIVSSHFTQNFFPPREYGIFVAAAVMTLMLGVTVTLASVRTILWAGAVGPEESG
ncbi:dolichol phosphate-mannose biosynthesis regulatory protein (DPM2) [Trypanosoma brucei equiperdum]|uniref:Dolichol phosphate-mannose biosynthesis regulatory protein n=1 Tax=Trypanosoma brucei equiperdum TaxID=630700 RepID=A0A3L6L3D4_9TRYP|nr:dolichol phosphate-mannose biosynthesis regulatory protein (DPM2) [Trypanosoma brucei equiperdum]